MLSKDNVSTKLLSMDSRDVEAIIFQPLPLPLTKNEKHSFILRRQKHSFIAITLPTSLKLIVPN